MIQKAYAEVKDLCKLQFTDAGVLGCLISEDHVRLVFVIGDQIDLLSGERV